MENDATTADPNERTWASGPSDPPCLADGPGTIVEVDIGASAATVWPLISDIEFGRAFSDEFVGARWAEGDEPLVVGSEFIGSNVHPKIGEREMTCFVDRVIPERDFGWVTSDRADPGAQWRFELEPLAESCRLRFHLRLGPGPSRMTVAIERMPDMEARILIGRLKEHRANMQRVVDGIKAAAEAAPGVSSGQSTAPAT